MESGSIPPMVLENRSGFDNPLPKNILKNIIHYVESSKDLRSLALVCHDFLSPPLEKLWSTPRFPNYNPRFKQFIATLSSPFQALPYSTFVQVLNLDGLGPFVTDSDFQVLSGCHRVRSLEIAGCTNIEASTLQNTLYQFHNLHAVDFEGLASTVTDGVITALAQSNPELQGVKLGRCAMLTNAALVALANHCGDSLQEVYLQRLPLIGAFGMRRLVARCPKLQTLDLGYCEVVDDSIARLVWTWTSLNLLRKLSFAGCSSLTDQMLPANEPWYEGYVPPPPVVTSVLVQSLRHLDLTDCVLLTDASIATIIQNTPKLHVLNLKNCRLLTDASLKAIAGLGSSVHQLILSKLPEITDEGIKALVAGKCKRLTGLDLSECKKLTDDGVRYCSTFSRIESLRFNVIDNITDHGIWSLANLRRPTLKRLHLSFCRRVTTASIHHLLNKQPQISFMSLSGVPAFLLETDTEFKKLSNRVEKGWKPEAFRVYSGEATIAALRKVLNKKHSVSAQNSTSQTRSVSSRSNAVSQAPPEATTFSENITLSGDFLPGVAHDRRLQPPPTNAPKPPPPLASTTATSWYAYQAQLMSNLDADDIAPRGPPTLNTNEDESTSGSTPPPPPPPPKSPQPRRQPSGSGATGVHNPIYAPLANSTPGNVATMSGTTVPQPVSQNLVPGPSTFLADDRGYVDGTSAVGAALDVQPLKLKARAPGAKRKTTPPTNSLAEGQSPDSKISGQARAKPLPLGPPPPPPPPPPADLYVRPTYPPMMASDTTPHLTAFLGALSDNPSPRSSKSKSKSKQKQKPSASPVTAAAPPPPPEPILTPTRSTPPKVEESDPDHLSGSMSSFEDLEDTTYDILALSDLDSEHEDDLDVDYDSECYYDDHGPDDNVRPTGAIATSSTAGNSPSNSKGQGLGASAASGQNGFVDEDDEDDFECVEMPDKF